jgi:F-type H+-transporting ATPase subunit delta
MQAAKDEAAEYAAALVSLGKATGSLDSLEQDMARAAELIGDNHDVKRFVSDPHVRDEGKRAAFEELLAPHVSRLLLDFLLLLLDQGKAGRVAAVAEAFAWQSAALRDEVAGEVVSARELAPAKIAAIEKEVSRLIGKQVHLQTRVSGDILGGVRVRVGSVVFDGTLDHHLEEYRRTLTRSV